VLTNSPGVLEHPLAARAGACSGRGNAGGAIAHAAHQVPAPRLLIFIKVVGETQIVTATSILANKKHSAFQPFTPTPPARVAYYQDDTVVMGVTPR
jgi:hypothetical protein